MLNAFFRLIVGIFTIGTFMQACNGQKVVATLYKGFPHLKLELSVEVLVARFIASCCLKEG
jgi:hypothetical protein